MTQNINLIFFVKAKEFIKLRNVYGKLKNIKLRKHITGIRYVSNILQAVEINISMAKVS